MTNPITTLSRERLEQLADENTICKVSWDERIEMSRALLEVMDTKPVAVNDEMAFSFHRSISDSAIGLDEVEEIKDGLRAALSNVTTTPAPSAPDGWIKCSERMPDEGSEVLVINEFGDMECACYQRPYIPGDLFFATCSGEVYPTHWIPLPAAPGGE